MKKILIGILVLLIVALVATLFVRYQSKDSTMNHAEETVVHEGGLSEHAKAHNQMGVIGSFAPSEMDPTTFLTTWNFNNFSSEERAKFYQETRLAGGKMLREYWITAEDKTIETAPGVWFPAWSYNGQVPGPTIRATEGDQIKVHFTNHGTHPHTLHFHGYHTELMDGSMPEEAVAPGGSFTYEFDATPFGIHLYHCHTLPLLEHISRGLYGVYIVDPKHDTRPIPDKELVMMMNGFDTNFDGENDVYAVNSGAFYYDASPIKVKTGELVRIFLVNILESDPVNSFHLHANFFDEYRTGTSLKPNATTDVVTMGQAERSILDTRFKYPGKYMFHAHQTEFTEKGWSGLFQVE